MITFKLSVSYSRHTRPYGRSQPSVCPIKIYIMYGQQKCNSLGQCVCLWFANFYYTDPFSRSTAEIFVDSGKNWKRFHKVFFNTLHMADNIFLLENGKSDISTYSRYIKRYRSKQQRLIPRLFMGCLERTENYWVSDQIAEPFSFAVKTNDTDRVCHRCEFNGCKFIIVVSGVVRVWLR